jgi:hypothetical protein
MGWAGNVVRMVEIRNVYRIFVGNTEGKRTFGRRRRRWEVNIKIVLREIGLKSVNWIYLARDRD